MEAENQESPREQDSGQSALLEIQIEEIRRRAYERGYEEGFATGYSRRALDDLNKDLKEFAAK